jgi:hypothetical protein
MKKSFALFSLLLAGFSTFGQLSCDLRLDDVQFTSTGPYPQPVLTISNLGLEPVTTAQIRWGISTQSQSVWPFSSSSWGGLLESGEVTQLTMPAVSVPAGNWIYSFEIIALNNSNPIFGVCAGFDEDPSNNIRTVQIQMGENGCVDLNEDGFCDGEISSSVLDIQDGANDRIISTEYFNLLGMKVQHKDLEANRIYVKKSNFSDGQFSIQKIMIR